MENPITNWRKRHKNPTSFWLHILGIPSCFVVAPILLIARQWWLAAGFFVAGYVLQFIGHMVEGNQSGEEMLARRIASALKRRR